MIEENPAAEIYCGQLGPNTMDLVLVFHTPIAQTRLRWAVTIESDRPVQAFQYPYDSSSATGHVSSIYNERGTRRCGPNYPKNASLELNSPNVEPFCLTATGWDIPSDTTYAAVQGIEGGVTDAVHLPDEIWLQISWSTSAPLYQQVGPFIAFSSPLRAVGEVNPAEYNNEQISTELQNQEIVDGVEFIPVSRDALRRGLPLPRQTSKSCRSSSHTFSVSTNSHLVTNPQSEGSHGLGRDRPLISMDSNVGLTHLNKQQLKTDCSLKELFLVLQGHS